MKNLKLAIVGHGFVGKAVDFGFSVNVDKTILILFTEQMSKIFLLDIPDVIFICVPTPMKINGAIDCSIILNVIKDITEMGLDSV